MNQRILHEKRCGGGSSPSGRTIFPATHAPRWWVKQAIDRLEIEGSERILEPSAGSGGIVEALQQLCFPVPQIVALELNKRFFEVLRGKCEAYRQDFFAVQPNDIGHFDRVIMCPPKNSDAHIEHAIQFLRPGGKLFALVQEKNVDISRWNYVRLLQNFEFNGEPIICGEIYNEVV